MESAEVANNWRELYKAALLENDPGKTRIVIRNAYRAIQKETRRRWYAGSLTTAERQSLDAASHYLETLYSLTEHRRRQAA